MDFAAQYRRLDEWYEDEKRKIYSKYKDEKRVQAIDTLVAMYESHLARLSKKEMQYQARSGS